MQPPTNGAHLQQFLCALQWVRSGIPKFAELTNPLQFIVERTYEHAGKRTKRAVTKFSFIYGLGKNEQEAFDECKQALGRQVTLTNRDYNKRPCAFTDASDHIWSGIITQIPLEDT